MFKKLAKLILPAFCAFLLSYPVQLRAGFGNEAFEDDPSLRQDENLEWPEVEFPSAEERGRGFKPGESFEYRAQWGWFRKAGRIAFSTEASDDLDQPALLVKTETSSAGMIRAFYPMNLSATTVLDSKNWRMIRNETKGKVRSDKSSTITLFDFDRGLMNYEDEVEPRFNHIRKVPYDCPIDYASVFLQLRGMDLAVGKSYPIFVSTKGKFYYALLQVMKTEELDTDIGDVDCFRLEPVSSYPVSKVFREGGKMAIWITTDERRIPVRFDVKTSVGNASIRLEKYKLATD